MSEIRSGGTGASGVPIWSNSTVPEGTVVGRAVGGDVAALTGIEASGVLGPWVEPECDRTESVDASAAINALVNAGVKLIHLRTGRYKLTSAITLATGVRIRGDGPGRTVLLPYGEVCAIRKNGSLMSDVNISDLEIDGSNQTATTYQASTTKGIYTNFIYRASFLNLYIHHTGATGLGVDHFTGSIHNVTAANCGRLNDGTEAGGSGIGIGVGDLNGTFEPLSISNCHTSGNARYGIFIENQNASSVDGISVVGCTATANKDGFGACGGSAIRFVGCTAYLNTRSGFAVDGGTFSPGAPTPYVTIDACDSHANTGDGVLITTADATEDIDGVRVMNSSIRGNGGRGVHLLLNDLDSGHYVRRVRIGSNDVFGNGADGIHVANAGSVTDTVRHIRIDGNRCYNNTGAGILVDVASSDLLVDGNQCWDDQGSPTQTAGIKWSQATDGTAATSNLTVVDNGVGGCPTPVILPASAAISGTTTVRRNRGHYAPLTHTFLQMASDGTDASSYTFSAQSVGAEAADRIIVAAITARAGSALTLSSVTIGGVSATTVVSSVDGTGTVVAIAYAALPSESTADVVVTFSGTMVRCAVALYRVTGGSLSAVGASGVTSATVATVAGGFVVAAGYAAATVPHWTGVTQDWGADIEPTGRISSGGSAAISAGGSVTPTVVWDSGGGTGKAMAAAAFAPTTEYSA